MLNTTIKDYLIQRELGRGGMAVVYLAHDIKFDTNVAVKLLNKEYVHNDNIRKRFLAEAKNMFRMSHPNIIKVTDLIDAGVELNSYTPEYYYTKLAELKIKMIEAATKDANNRAEKIAINAGSKLGGLKNAEMGVFQISAENSSEDYSWGGNFNTTSKKKTANITVRLRYEID